MEDMLDKVVKLLAYISDKDLFAEFYRKRLSRRLLQDKSASDDHERAVLTRLKQQCGAQFTSKARPAPAPRAAPRGGHLPCLQAALADFAAMLSGERGPCVGTVRKQIWGRLHG